ncbi:MAG: ATP-binding protein [Acidobacteria bacterium]|nr:ATP-binding protein [Acidobacteriota bacterium]
MVGVRDGSDVALARRVAVQCAESLRMDETVTAKVALVATELATNLVKHAQGGSMLFASDESRPHALTLITIDKGRGFANLNAAMRDGYSTAGSPGTGLGAIQRASDRFDVYSVPDRGAAVLCTFENGSNVPAPPASGSPSRIVYGGVCIPKPGEDQPGDGWAAIPSRESVTIAVADGLGHGGAAADASHAALRVIRARPDADPERMFQDAHGALRATRGAALAVARIYASLGRIDFTGIGNIAGTITSDEGTRRTVSTPGIVGHEMRRVQTFSYPWTASSVLFLHSDGVSTNWNATQYPGLMQHDPALIAAVIFRDYCRGTDDATVVVAKAS